MTLVLKITFIIGFFAAVAAAGFACMNYEDFTQLRTELNMTKAKVAGLRKENDTMMVQFVELQWSNTSVQQIVITLAEAVKRIESKNKEATATEG